MKFAVRHFVLGLLVSLFFAGSASAQYLKITTDNPTDNTQMRASGTTVLTISLNTNHDKDGSVQTCNSHTAASCGSTTTANPLDIGGFTLTLSAVGGTVTWGAFSPANTAYADLNGGVPLKSSTQIEVDYGRASGFDTPGLYTLGTISVTPTSGNPGVNFARGSQPVNPFGFGTGFGTECDAFNFPNTYVLAAPSNFCATGDFVDADGASAPGPANTQPVITAPATASATEGSAMATITANATDADGTNTLTITQTGMPADLTFTATPGASPRTATITGTPGFTDAGVYNIIWTVNDGTGGGTATNTATTVLTIANTNRAPTLTQPNNMAVAENATANQPITGTDPDGDALTFSKVSGPAFMTVTTVDATDGNIHLAPGFSDSGTYTATARATDTGALFNDKGFQIIVSNVNRAPVLAQPANMTVTAGATADQTLNATDPDGDPLAFSLVSGPTYASVTTTTAGTGTATGNIHLAPGASNIGTAAATVRASDGTANSDKSITITVNAALNQAPVLTQPANMTVNEGATADQTLNATDPDGNPLTFSLVSGPTYASVTTTTAGTGTATGNIHLAPGFSDAGTAVATVRASDGSLSSNKSLTITVNNVNRAPTLNQPANMSVAQGGTADQVITGSDPDGDALIFSKVSGPAFMTVSTTNATTGNIHLAAGVSEPVGSSSATVRASDGTANSDKTLTVTVTATNQAPVLAQPANMTVNEGATADQTLNATDPDGNPLTFSLVSGPTYASVTTTTAGTGTATGNIHLAPGFSDAGTAAATVRASDGSLSSNKSLTITVNNVNRAPTLNVIANMTVTAGATADQVITGSDPDGDALTFSKATGPTFLTVSTTNATTGSIHLAPTVGDVAGSPYSASASASDGTSSDTKSFTITVNPAAQPNRTPVLTQPADMTVNEGATANQLLSATDPDGDALTFSKVGGPGFMTVTTTNATTGNVHLAPGFADAGTYGATVRASDGSLSDDKSFTITVNNVSAAFEANAFINGGDRVIRLNSSKPFWCVELEPTAHSFSLNDIITSTILATYNGTSIHPSFTRLVTREDCSPRLEVCFSKDQLRILFGSLPDGRQSVTVVISGDLSGGGSFRASVDVVVVKGGAGELAKGDEGNLDFSRASPNPFNPSTVISFELSKPGSVKLNVYDVTGRLVKTLADQSMGTGPHEVAWDGTSRNGSRVASGVYFYVLQTAERTVKSQLVVAK